MNGRILAIGALLLFVLAYGYATQPDTSDVSAMVRGDEARAKVSRASVRVDLRDILVP
jgi:hypothetical protein